MVTLGGARAPFSPLPRQLPWRGSGLNGLHDVCSRPCESESLRRSLQGLTSSTSPRLLPYPHRVLLIMVLPNLGELIDDGLMPFAVAGSPELERTCVIFSGKLPYPFGLGPRVSRLLHNMGLVMSLFWCFGLLVFWLFGLIMNPYRLIIRSTIDVLG